MTIRDWVFLTAIALIALSALLFIVISIRFKQFLTTQAVVTAVDVNFVDGDKNFQAVYTFRDKTGREVKGRSVSRVNYSPYLEGQQIKVLYSPENPEKSMINSFREKYAWPLTFLAMGIVVSIVGLMFR